MNYRKLNDLRRIARELNLPGDVRIQPSGEIVLVIPLGGNRTDAEQALRNLAETMESVDNGPEAV